MKAERSLLMSLMVALAMLGTLLPAQAPADAHRIEDLGWISGHWQMTGKTSVEEHWTQPAGGTMLGVNRTLRGGKTVAFEFLRIETRPQGIFYVAHPNAQPGTDFRLTALSATEAIFENPAHDFPKRLVYRRNADGSLTARADGGASSADHAVEFLFLPVAHH